MFLKRTLFTNWLALEACKTMSWRGKFVWQIRPHLKLSFDFRDIHGLGLQFWYLKVNWRDNLDQSGAFFCHMHLYVRVLSLISR